MDIQRTIRIRLRPDSQTALLLQQTMATYTWSFNAVCRLGWEQGITNGIQLHKATYYEHRAITGMPAQLTCAARVKATEALKSAKARVKKGRQARCPQSPSCPIRYDARSYQIWFDRNEVSLLTLQGRVRLPFSVPAYYAAYITWQTTSADLVRDRQGRWWLHVVMATQLDATPAHGKVVGLDLGLVMPAADSRGNYYGSDHWKVVETKTFELRRQLQAKGTKSARRHLKRLSGRQRRFRRDCDHFLSKRIVCAVEPGTTLVFEDLTDIRARVKARKKQRRRIHGWSFHQLQAFTTYKAERRGVKVSYVDPRYTSQQCSACGHIAPANRQTQAEFSCKSCGFEANADLNAAVNIRHKYLLSLGGPVNPPIVSIFGSGTSSTLNRQVRVG